MDEVYITFEETGREGSVAVGTYLIDAAGRLGVEIDCDCGSEEPTSQCAVKISRGATILSAPTVLETEHLSASERKASHRLACQARLEKSGEIDLMTAKKKKKEEAGSEEKSTAQGFKEEFEEMPLKEKISSLMELEMMALGETVSYVVNSPYEAVGKVMEVMAGFGYEKDKQDRDAKVPDEHSEEAAEPEKKVKNEEDKNGSDSSDQSKAKTTKTPAAKKTRARKRPEKKKEEEDKG